jgi:glycosyltransferase involved in cell wall biosynthesis
MNLLYLTKDYPHDKSGWSGLTFYIGKSLQKAGNHLEYINGFTGQANFLMRLKQKIYPKLTGKFLQPQRHKSFYKFYQTQIDEQIINYKNLEYIFSNSSEPIGAYESKIPMAYWTDATFAGMLGYYPEFNNLHAETIKAANELEQKALNKSKAIFFSSDWAAETALRNYKVSENKIHVVPFGANIDLSLNIDLLNNQLAKKDFNKCKLLFIGVYWERKGGDKALEITQELIKMGINAQLTIVGCQPFDDSGIPNYVIQKGFLNKNIDSERKELDNLILESHFLVLPTLADCTPVVYNEANAFGLPVISTKTGGIGTIIKHGVNGGIFDSISNPKEYAAFIAKYFNSIELYQEISRSSFKEYNERLNWEVAGEKVTRILQIT